MLQGCGGNLEQRQNDLVAIVPRLTRCVNPTPHFPGVVQLLTQAHDRGEVHVTVAMARLLIRLLAGRGGGHE